MRTRLIAILTALACATSLALAQESDAKRINKIKRDSKYLYAESTMPTEEEARQGAEETLGIYIDEYVENQKDLAGAGRILIKDLQSKIDYIEMKRGTLVRAFAYVKKSDIVPADNIVVIDGPAVTHNEEEPLETTEQQPDTQQQSDMQPASYMAVAYLPQWQQELIGELLEKNSIVEARTHLNRLKAEYKVRRLGPATSAKNASALYWVVQPASGGLIVLGPGTEQRVNFRTMQADRLENYSGCDALWFEMAK